MASFGLRADSFFISGNGGFLFHFILFKIVASIGLTLVKDMNKVLYPFLSLPLPFCWIFDSPVT